jgi:hypothetical protein
MFDISFFKMMSSAVTDRVKIPKLNYLDGGFQSVTSETQHFKYRGVLSWNIQDFLICSKFKEDKFQFRSPIFELVFGNSVLKFELTLQLNDKADDHIGFFLYNKNDRHLDIDYHYMALNNSDSPFASLKSSRKFKPHEGWGLSKFMSKKDLESCKDHLPGGTLKLKVELTVYVNETSTLIKDDPEYNNGSTLADGLAKFYNKNSFNDFELKCGDETFPCHKVILASRSDVFEAMFSQVSISPTSYKHLFVQECFAQLFSSYSLAP